MRGGLALGALLALGLGGCSYTFDSSAEDLPLLGAPPVMGSLPRLNDGATAYAAVVAGRDRAYWFAMVEPPSVGDFPSGTSHVIHLVRLSPPEQEAWIPLPEGTDLLVTWRAFYLIAAGVEAKEGVEAVPARITIRQAGDEGSGPELEVPPGPGLLYSGGSDDVFAYVVGRPEVSSFEIIRRDGSFRRSFDLPPGVAATNPQEQGGFFFDSGGKLFFVRDAEGYVSAYSTVDETAAPVEFGQRPRLLGIDTRRKALVGCGDDGLRSVLIADPADELLLDGASCAPRLFYFVDGSAYYFARLDDGAGGERHELRVVPLDRAEYPRPVFEPPFQLERVLDVGPDQQIIYSQDPSSKYIYGVGDGWIGDWRFMDRGRGAGFSRDGKRVRWLEHAAKATGAGDLLSAQPGGAPLRLGRNVRQFDELSDGRVLAVANFAFLGTQNRVVVVDEDRREARWVAAESSQYRFIPGSTDVLVDVVTGPSTFDIVRVPVPPREAADAGVPDGGSAAAASQPLSTP